MAFSKMTKPKYPPRQWAIYGDAGAGKSHFASQMKGPALVIDADGRFTEQLDNAAGEILQLSDTHIDNTDPDRIAQLLRANLPGSGVRTIVVDSLTAILRPVINAALSDIDHKRVKNKIAAFRNKAMTMSLLQDSITGSGCDVLWIWHTHRSMMGYGEDVNTVERASIPQTELVRLRRSLNVILKLEVNQNTGQRSVLVEWARNGKSGMKLADDAGGWRGMPELIESAIYADGVRNGDEMPTKFSSVDDAIAWGFEQGCFRDAIHAQRSYEKCKREKQPQSAAQMWSAWIAKVLAYKSAGQMAEDEPEQTTEQPQSELVAA